MPRKLHVVQINREEKRIEKILKTPIEVFVATQKFGPDNPNGSKFVVCVEDASVKKQTICGIPVVDLLNDRRRKELAQIMMENQ